jgi:spore maturation protein CgeB
VTRADMIRAGYSPSVRLFEAAACGTPIISDVWDGIDTVLRPGHEIVLAHGPDDVLGTLSGLSEASRQVMARAARDRILAEHTADRRAMSLEEELKAVIGRRHGRRRHVLAAGA